MSAPRKIGRISTAAPQGAAARARLTDALAEAGWIAADRALAQAMTELDDAASAATPMRRAEALSLLRQSLARAARARGFSRLGGEEGEIERYDPLRHEFVIAPKRKPKLVMILARGVTRGAEVLVKARVKAARQREPV